MTPGWVAGASATVLAYFFPDEAAQILADVAAIDIEIAKSVLLDRTNLAVDAEPGADQLKVLKIIGPIFVESGAVASQDQIDEALDTLFNTDYVKNANPDLIG